MLSISSADRKRCVALTELSQTNSSCLINEAGLSFASIIFKSLSSINWIFVSISVPAAGLDFSASPIFPQAVSAPLCPPHATCIIEPEPFADKHQRRFPRVAVRAGGFISGLRQPLQRVILRDTEEVVRGMVRGGPRRWGGRTIRGRGRAHNTPRGTPPQGPCSSCRDPIFLPTFQIVPLRGTPRLLTSNS